MLTIYSVFLFFIDKNQVQWTKTVLKKFWLHVPALFLQQDKLLFTFLIRKKSWNISITWFSLAGFDKVQQVSAAPDCPPQGSGPHTQAHLGQGYTHYFHSTYFVFTSASNLSDFTVLFLCFLLPHTLLWYKVLEDREVSMTVGIV